MAPYVGKLLVDAGADVVKVESPAGDAYRSWSASGTPVADGGHGPWFAYLNAGKRSTVVDLDAPGGRDDLLALVGEAHLVIDDHAPARASALGVTAADLRAGDPSLVVATLTRFGADGPWAGRPANDFILQALVGSTELRGFPGEEPVSVGGELGDFIGAAMAAPGVLATTLAAVRTGRGAHVDVSQYEAMMHCFQIYRPIFDAFFPGFRMPRTCMIPSIEPASDGQVGFCCVTAQQWQDFCVVIEAPEWADDEELLSFNGRMARRDEVWARIRAATSQRTVDELVELAMAFRIPVGPVGDGADLLARDHLVERGTFREHPEGFSAPRPPYRFSSSVLAPVRAAPALGAAGDLPGPAPAPTIGDDPDRPLGGVRIVDLSAFWAGPVATNMLRVLGADVVKVESHVRLDGMRWASGMQRDLLWEWSPGYHGANVGKTAVTLDLTRPEGIDVLGRLIDDADVVVENFSPRVTEQWGVTWDWIKGRNPRAVFVRAPAFGLDGPWRDRTGFAMTMEQVAGLANRTGHPDGPLLIPQGPVDYLAASHLAFGVLLALADRERSGEGQMIELPLMEAALQSSAEQVVEWSAHGATLGPMGNRSTSASPQRLYATVEDDRWLAVSVESDAQWSALCGVVSELDGLDRHDVAAVDPVLEAWAVVRPGGDAADKLWRAGVPSAWCEHPNDTALSAQHAHRGFFQWIDHDLTGATPYHSYPYRIDGAHLPYGGPSPMLGEHTDRVLADLGYDEADVAALREAGVTGDWPAGVPRR